MRTRDLFSKEFFWWPLLTGSLSALLVLLAWEFICWLAGSSHAPTSGGVLTSAVAFAAGLIVGLLLSAVWYQPGWRTYCAVDDLRHSWGRAMHERAAECACGKVWSSEGRTDRTAAFVYGPYESKLKAGTYIASIRMRLAGAKGAAPPRGAVVVDYARSHGSKAVELAVGQVAVRTDLGEAFRDFDMRFTVGPEDRGSVHEWRIFLPGPDVTIEVDRVTVRRVSPHWVTTPVSLARHSKAAEAGVDPSASVASTAPPPAPSPPVAERRVLFSFIPGTPDEESHIFLNVGWRPSEVDSGLQARVTYLDQKVIYDFTIPTDVSGADLIVEAWNSFALAIARDVGGGPGEFHEELNALTSLRRIDYEGRTQHEYALDLTPYLEDNPSRTIYVAIYSADQTTGWGAAAWSQVQVAALDAAEEKRIARIRREADYQMKKERARCLLHLRTNSADADASYLHEDRGSEMGPYCRVVNGTAEVIYRIPLKPEYDGARLQVWVLGDSLVSYAADERGRPGEFTDVFRARDKFDQHVIETYTNPDCAEVLITKPILDARAVYIRIRDGDPDRAGAAQIHALSIMRL